MAGPVEKAIKKKLSRESFKKDGADALAGLARAGSGNTLSKWVSIVQLLL